MYQGTQKQSQSEWSRSLAGAGKLGENDDQLLGYADVVREDEENAVVYIENGAGKNIVTMIVSGTTKETSLERWRAAIDGVNAAEARS